MADTTTSNEKKTVLVTGGSGFIGSHLCEELLKQYNVICLDDFTSSTIENVKHLLENPYFEFIKHDISQPIDLSEYRELDKFKVRFEGIHELYHLATPTSPKNFNKLRIKTLRTTGIGTIHALEIAKQYNAKFLLASSVVVYGPRFKDAPRFTEDYDGYVDPISPRSCYDEGKRFSESAVVTYRDMYNLDAKIVRIFRTYGPRLTLFEGHMVPDFVLQALNNKPLLIYGDESFTTSLCYISDVIEGLVKMMNSREPGPLNIGQYEEHRMVDIAKKIKEMTQSESPIEFRESMMFMRPLGLPDISKAKQKLGWYPLVPLDKGLAQTIDYVKAHEHTLGQMLWKYDEKMS